MCGCICDTNVLKCFAPHRFYICLLDPYLDLGMRDGEVSNNVFVGIWDPSLLTHIQQHNRNDSNAFYSMLTCYIFIPSLQLYIILIKQYIKINILADYRRHLISNQIFLFCIGMYWLYFYGRVSFHFPHLKTLSFLALTFSYNGCHFIKTSYKQSRKIHKLNLTTYSHLWYKG